MTQNTSETPEYIVFKDEQGEEQQYKVDALIEMNGHQYVLYTHDRETKMNRIEHENDKATLCTVSDEEAEALMDAYRKGLEEDLEEEK
ncbi:DUF1292 domain-containing protein [Pontibacillus yanchengensis]|uniref:DUF1292 domain-containing protein n=1 Tax=Pontibacillus yanchengensis Y32 TaxID=1385514 RepID=A0A0A2TFC9_9BACI|nr:DUF1292 domain-containing protein [Pontibacillus yanchengensis]KGP72801.1 hypothetical protein N782_10415 [Pontibacillus yanchengensis Y32]